MYTTNGYYKQQFYCSTLTIMIQSTLRYTYRLLHGKGTHTAFLHELVIQTNKYQNTVQVPSP